jgi:hypothetical protein
VTKSEDIARAREFLDKILKLNKQHGVRGSAGAIQYEAAVKAAARTPRRLRKARSAGTQKRG